MPSSIGHAAVAVLLAPVLVAQDRRPAVLWSAAVAAAVVDIDAIGRLFGAGDVAWLGGHRGLTHSFAVAVLLGAVIGIVLARRSSAEFPVRVAAFMILVIASHGVLDGFTAYGEGVALFAPFSQVRWKSSWQPLDDLWPEMIALWLPAWVMLQFRRKRRSGWLSR
jgi:inner membrane protein